jgi:hypothetical protein
MVKRKTTTVQSEVVEDTADAGQTTSVVADEAPDPAGMEESTMVTAENADEKREDGEEEEEEGEELEYTIEKILKERTRKGICPFPAAPSQRSRASSASSLQLAHPHRSMMSRR